MSLEKLSQEAKKQIVIKVLTVFAVNKPNNWNNLRKMSQGIADPNYAIPAFLGLTADDIEAVKALIPNPSSFHDWDEVKNRLGEIINHLENIAQAPHLAEYMKTHQEAIDHYAERYPNEAPQGPVMSGRYNNSSSVNRDDKREDLDLTRNQRSGYKTKKCHCTATALKSLGSFLFESKRPKTRATLGFVFAGIGAGLVAFSQSPWMAAATLGMTLNPLTLKLILAAGIFLATVGTLMFIHGLIANCSQQKQVSQYLPIEYDPTVYNVEDDNDEGFGYI